MGFGWDFTAAIPAVSGEKAEDRANRRHTLLGNAWHVSVAVFLLQVLCGESVVQQAVPAAAYTGPFMELYGRAQSACPYLQDLAARGKQPAGLLGPDWAECNAHSPAARRAEGLQQRRETWAACRTSLLPRDLDPGIFFVTSPLVQSPLDDEPLIPDDLDFAIRMTAALGKGAAAWRRRQLALLREFGDSDPSVEAYWEARRAGFSLEVSRHLHPHRFDVSSAAIRWPDARLPEMLASGSVPLGRLETTGVYRAADRPASLSVDDLLAGSREALDRLEASPAPSSEQAGVIWQLSEEEREAGYIGPWLSRHEMDDFWEGGAWRAIPRYATWQGTKWRLIDDGRRGGHNDATGADERIHTTSTSAGVAAVRRLRAALGHPFSEEVHPVLATRDLRKAYKQVPLHESVARLCIVAVWHPYRN